jgi:hypothetical protein
MKTHAIITRILPLAAAALAAAAHPLRAGELAFAGVLGNSGEQGPALVRFGPLPAVGMGIVVDSGGGIWDRAGNGVLNRYAPDGRLLATHPIPAPAHAGRGQLDTIARLGSSLLLKIDGKLHALPLDAPPGTAPAALSVAVDRLSFNATPDGRAAAIRGRELFLVNAKGEKETLATLDAGRLDAVEVGPDGGIYVQSGREVRRVDPAAPADKRGPWPSPGDRFQWIDGHWYAKAWHGTLRRFDPDFSPNPGVVLGGGSGAFIGYVEGNTEIEFAPGLALLRPGLFAVSGDGGVVHLLSWDDAGRRFSIVRRIGAKPTVTALTIDAAGRVWCDGGLWPENAGPASPQRHGAALDDRAMLGASMLPGGYVVSPGFRAGRPFVWFGSLDQELSARQSSGIPEITKNHVASAVVSIDGRLMLLIVDAAGRGISYRLGNDGNPSGPAAAFTLQSSAPLATLTSLASPAPGVLAVAAGGQIIRFAYENGSWRETARFDRWSADDGGHFGPRVFVAAADGILWVSDTERHRVLGFDAAAGAAPLAIFGKTDAAGDDLVSLRAPALIAAAGSRLVLFDSGNQRLVRLVHADTRSH